MVEKLLTFKESRTSRFNEWVYPTERGTLTQIRRVGLSEWVVGKCCLYCRKVFGRDISMNITITYTLGMIGVSMQG